MTTVPNKRTRAEEPGEESGAQPLPKEGDARRLLVNRELSLLEFFRRVLEEGLDESQPLLERLKFLTIFSTNLDEFFMVRVSGLKEHIEKNVTELSPDGMTQAEQLTAIRERLLPMFAEQMRCLREEVLPKLAAEGVSVVRVRDLPKGEQAVLKEYFVRKVYPVLTPQGVDPSHPFPYISNLSHNLGLVVEAIPEHGITQSLTGKVEPRFLRLKIPPLVPRLVPVAEGEARFVLLEDLIASNLATLFPRMHVRDCHAFRVTRNADVDIRDDEAHDLLEMMEDSLRQRRFGAAVRLEVSSTMPENMVSYLTEALELTPEDVYVIDGPLNVPDLMALYKLDRPDLKDQPFEKVIPNQLTSFENVFDAIRCGDVFLHHPYVDYRVVTDFISAAADDSDVVAIKICLYRTGQQSPIPESLIRASEKGKQVTALVELKARFDEENNIEWAKRLEEAGVHVVYGILGLKTHCKVALVVRQEGEDLRRYVHVASGNYNPVTSNFYTDIGLFTANDDFGADATDLFNFLTGYSRQKEYRQFLVAPVNLRDKMLRLIEREAEHARAGRPARIIAKNNRLADVPIINALYAASQAGVEMDLIVRGVCMLRPGLPGVSETIRVRSIVGRFLEHSRIYYFANGGEEEVFVGSADWMPRNLDRRVEVIAPVHDPKIKKHLKEVVLAAYLRDNVKARVILPDGTHERVPLAPGEEKFNSQTYFIGSP